MVKAKEGRINAEVAAVSAQRTPRNRGSKGTEKMGNDDEDD